MRNIRIEFQLVSGDNFYVEHPFGNETRELEYESYICQLDNEGYVDVITNEHDYIFTKRRIYKHGIIQIVEVEIKHG